MIIEREKSQRRVLSGHPLKRHHRRARGPSDWTLLHLGRFERHGRIHQGPRWRGLHYALEHHHGRTRLILAWRGHDHLHQWYAALDRLYHVRHGGSRLLGNLRGRGRHHRRRRVGQRRSNVGTTPARNRGDARRRHLSHLNGKTLLGCQPQGVTRPQEPTQR